MAKRRNNILIVSVVIIVVLLLVWFTRRGEKYTPGDTKFFESTLPGTEEATIIQPGDIEKGKKYNTPNGEYYFMLREDGELVWANKSGEVLWFLGTEGAGDNASARFLNDGKICVTGTKMSLCTNSENTEVPSGQHLLILKNTGNLYMDHGAGTRKSYIFYPKIDDNGGDFDN